MRLREQIKENPYLHYFVGLKEYAYDAPFDSSLMVYFRKRFGMNEINAINEKIFKVGRKDQDDDPPPKSSPGKKGKKNKGRLIIDATCAPAEILYPTELSLLNEAREKTEKND